VHLRRGADGRRRVAEIAVLEQRAGVVRAVTAVTFDAAGRVVTGDGARRLERLLRTAGGAGR
jgi:hypothetical protein